MDLARKRILKSFITAVLAFLTHQNRTMGWDWDGRDNYKLGASEKPRRIMWHLRGAGPKSKSSVGSFGTDLHSVSYNFLRIVLATFSSNIFLKSSIQRQYILKPASVQHFVIKGRASIGRFYVLITRYVFQTLQLGASSTYSYEFIISAEQFPTL